MALTAPQIETVREITLETSLSDITDLLAEITAAQETRLLAIIADWDTIRFKQGDMIPSRENELFYAQEGKRRQVRHTIRLMLGLPVISDAEIEMAELNGMYGTLSAGLPQPAGGRGGVAEFGIFSAGGIGGSSELGG